MQKQDLTAARAFYSEALEITQIADLERAKLLGNRSVCYTQLGYSDLAKADAEEAAELAPEWGKAHYRLGCLRLQVTEHHSSPLITVPHTFPHNAAAGQRALRCSRPLDGLP